MKDGFETLKDSLDLASFAMDGYLGVLVYIAIGSVATVVIQSSSATMAIIITALASAQISYENALALAVGANVGTTVTAILGSLTSNENGKRLAAAHFIFNIATGLIAFVFIYQLATAVDSIARFFNIALDNYTIKLAIFHTLFNVLGILLVTPFIRYIVRFVQSLIQSKAHAQSKPKFISDVLIDVPNSAHKALEKEVVNLYKKHKKQFYMPYHSIVQISFIPRISQVLLKNQLQKIDTNIDEIYNKNLKTLYSEIIKFASLSQKYMNTTQSNRIYNLKIAAKIL